jgi:hypothetical protein
MNQLIVLGPGRFLIVAVAVFAVWRALCWYLGRRRGAAFDIRREAVVVLVFGWAIVVASVVFFPMNIILYDWHGTLSLIPFKSSIDLLRYSTPFTAVKNIGGNVLLFVPLGVLLPLLFEKLRRPWPLLWRAAVVSAAIELVQIPTQVRATDVDDVIWNVVGALIGLALFRLVWAAARRHARPGLAAAAGGSAAGPARAVRRLSLFAREPLLAALVPIVATLVLTAGALAPSVVSGTLSQDQVLRSATAGIPGATAVARADLAGHTFLVAAAGEGGAELLQYTEYQRVLPGRFTWTTTGDIVRQTGSGYSWTLTTYNATRGEKPLLVVWGRNQSGAAVLVVSAKGEPTRTIAVEKYFLAALPFDPDADVADDGAVNEVDIKFVDGAGRDLTPSFARW